MARHHGDRTEFANSPTIAEEYAVEQSPFDVWQRHAAKRLPSARTEHQSRLLSIGALLLHQRNELTCDKRQGNEQSRDDDARYCKIDLDAMCEQPWPEQALQPKQQHEYHAADDRRDGKRQVDKRDQETFTGKIKFCDCPCGGNSEHDVQR